MNPRPVSRVNFGGDRLTKLPDHIRLHILTFLPIKEAIHTSLLSKSWINLWSHLSTLVFRLERNYQMLEYLDVVQRFIRFIDRALLSHNSQHLDRFSLLFDFCAKHDEKRLYSWLRYAVDRNVKHVDLISDMYDEWEDVGILSRCPSFLWQNDVLISLNLKNCHIYAPEIKCKSLTRLSLNFCFLVDNFVDKLLLGCPVLERLELVDCAGMRDLNICHDGLKELVIDGCGYDGGLLRISAPCLSSLSLLGFIRSKCQLSNSSALVEAFIDFQSSFPEMKDKHINVLSQMPNVKKHTVGPKCLKALSLLGTTHPPFSISSCRTLVLHLYQNRSRLVGLAWLLRSFPRLETLTMNIKAKEFSIFLSSRIDNAKTGFWESELSDGYFRFLDHLKNVNVIGPAPHHTETKYVTEFLKFILKHGKVLKTLSIKAKRDNESMSDGHSCLDTHFELAQTLLSFPRLSREAEIHFTVL